MFFRPYRLDGVVEVPVMVIASGDGYEDYIAMKSMECCEVVKVIAERMAGGSTVMADECRSYEVLDKLGYGHETDKYSERICWGKYI